MKRSAPLNLLLATLIAPAVCLFSPWNLSAQAYAQNGVLNTAPGLLQTPTAPLASPPPLQPKGFQISNLQPASEVFALSAFVEGNESIVVMWEMPPEYYLYRKSLSVTASTLTSFPAARFPPGVAHEDEFFGASEVYFDKVMLHIPLAELPEHTTIELELTYQGRAENRYCYPMQYVSLPVELP